MNDTEARQHESEARKAQKATKYSDEEIRAYINDSIDFDGMCAIEYLQTAQAMIAYNNMIDNRWRQ